MSTALIVCAPLRIEARALRTGLPAGTVLRTGYGPRRSVRHALRFSAADVDALAIAGFGGSVTDEVRCGDVVVATEVHGQGRVVHCPSAPLLAGALQRQGLQVHCGPVATRDHVVRGREREELALSGVLAVDMESSTLCAAAGTDRPLAVVRVVVDTPREPLAALGTPWRVLRALRQLRAVGPALAAWGSAVGDRHVLLPAPRSFCAGVERAIETVEQALRLRGAPVYVRKQIVHNAHVVRVLADRGAVFVEELDEVPDGASTVFSAHGVSPDVRREARRRGLDVIDATCPLVSKVHAEARRFSRDDGTVLLIGHDGHEETEGTLGEAPERTILVETVEDAETVEVRDPTRVAYLMQTTLSVEESAGIVSVLRRRFPHLRGPDSADICYATSNRQAALDTVAQQSDLVLVIGSANSSNSRRLVETARRHGVAAHLVDDVGDIVPEWLIGARTVGVTAGASAPPALVEEVLAALRGLGSVEVSEHRITEENIHFTLPREVS